MPHPYPLNHALAYVVLAIVNAVIKGCQFILRLNVWIVLVLIVEPRKCEIAIAFNLNQITFSN